MAQKRSFLTSAILARRRAPRPLCLWRRRARRELAHEPRRLRDVQADVVDAELEQPLARGTDIVGARPDAHRDPGPGELAAHAAREIARVVRGIPPHRRAQDDLAAALAGGLRDVPRPSAGA